MGDTQERSLSPSLSRNVYVALRRDILECRLPPNAELREKSLAERFVVSKSPVREALLRLEHERLITVEPRQGYKVAALSLEDASQSFGLRKVLESACAEAASAHASAEALAGLDQYKTMAPVAGEEATDTFIRYNRAFHGAVCLISGNTRLALITIDLIDQMERMIRLSFSSVSVAIREVLINEHAQIIEAIQSGDRRQAIRLTRLHISGAEKRVLGGLNRAAIHP